jgi:tetratricopeptide (TPR) repeat protein
MNSHLLIVTVGLCYVVIFGGISVLRREGLSTQFALEVLGITALVEAGVLLTDSTINPVLFLILIYLLSMRARILVDAANLLSARGRQRDAISLLQLALSLFPDRATRMIVMTNLGIVQLRRQNPESAQALLESVLEEAQGGGLDIKYEAACRYNLGLALQRQDKETEAIRHFNEAIEAFPDSLYSQAAERALEQRRRRKTKSSEPPDYAEASNHIPRADEG